jgi:hypothetical protein
LSLTASSSNPAVVDGAGLVLSGTGTNRALSVTPMRDASGPVWVTLTAGDAAGNNTATTFLLTVRPVNDPPTLDPIAEEDETRILRLRRVDL